MTNRDLQELLESIGARPIAITPVNPLQSAVSRRAAFRIDLDDGRTLKGHQLDSAAAAARAEQLCGCLPRESFPRVIARHGSALLSKWIAGNTLATSVITVAHRRRLAAILRAVHSSRLPADLPDATDEYPGGSWLGELTGKLDRLREGGAITADIADRARELSVAHAPPRRRVVLVHADLCPENVVVDAAGTVWVVDIDQIDLHAPEFDLARCWYRWPMTPDDRAGFEAAYGDPAVVESFRAHFLHWAVVVLVGAMAFRDRHGLAGAERPANLLRQVLTWPPARGMLSCG
jgi:thiamine kinase-like enzyme